MSRPCPVLLLVVASPLVLAACDKSPAPGAAPSASALASARPAAPPSPSAAPEPAPPPPDDLDVASLQKALKCPAATRIGAGPCGVLAGFATCTPFSATIPGGDGRWMGRGYVVEHGKQSDKFKTDQYTLLRLIKVPAAEVGPGQLPIKIAIADIPKDQDTAFNQAERAIRAFERQDVPKRVSPAVDYVKSRSSWTDAGATRTKGGHVYVITDGGAFVCQGSKQQLFLIDRDKLGAAAGDGLYAELWAISW
jgi:hypothetical protein